MKRFVAGVAALAASAFLFTGSASAHFLMVENQGKGTVHAEYERWVGGNGASHGKGLVVACEAHKAHGHSAALIDTPWNEGSCTHG